MTIRPDDSSWNGFVEQFPRSTLFDSDTTYDIRSTTIAPFEPVDADLYDGGGQQPAEVNKFLRFAQPLDNRIKVPAGTTSYIVIVYYGQTIIPSTFSATLNGLDVTSHFQPIPGSA